MASIRRRQTAKGLRWDVRYRDPDGKLRTRTEVTEAAARLARSKLELAIRDGSFIDPEKGKELVHERFTKWAEGQVQHRPGSRAVVRSAGGKLAESALGSMPLGKARREDVQAYVGWLVDQGLAPWTVSSYYRWTATMFRCSVLDGVLPRTPCMAIKLPEIARRRIVPLTNQEVEAIAGQMPARLQVVARVGARTGMRIGELAGFMADRICRDEPGSVTVDQQLHGAPTKTPASVRTIPVDEHTLALLVVHVWQHGLAPGGYVFSNASGSGHLDGSGFRLAFGRAAKKAGVTRRVTPHDLRHAYASRLIRAGLGVKEVQAVMGHKKAEETLDTYGHLWPDHADRVRLALAESFHEAA